MMHEEGWDLTRVNLRIAEIKARFAENPPTPGTHMSAFSRAVSDLPDEWKDFTALNAEESPKCPVITEKKDALESESCDQSRKKK